jgi:uncharacterized membrane protein
MSLLYISAGIYHFINPGVYVKIMPPWLPFPEVIVYVSGAAEIILGICLLYQPWRRRAAWGIIFLLLFVFPANIQMAINYHNENHPRFWGSMLRLPLQIMLIWWAYLYTKPAINLKSHSTSGSNTLPL